MCGRRCFGYIAMIAGTHSSMRRGHEKVVAEGLRSLASAGATGWDKLVRLPAEPDAVASPGDGQAARTQQGSSGRPVHHRVCPTRSPHASCPGARQHDRAHSSSDSHDSDFGAFRR